MFSSIDFASILPFALFAFVAGAAWFVADFFMGDRRNRAETRLDRLKLQSNPKGNEEKSGGGIKKLIAAASPSLGETLKPRTAKEIGALKSRLSAAGFRSELAVPYFATIKAMAALAGFGLAGGISLVMKGATMGALIQTVVAGLLAMFIPELILTLMAKGRKQKIFLSLPDALDLMVVCVEAGLGLDQAMRKVAEELEIAHPVISYEFKVCNQALQMGSSRADVLTDLGARNGVDDLKTLSSIIIQVDRFGTSVGTALRTQSETMRTRRKQIAEEKAAKTAVKLIFPLVIFIFPGIFVVLVGPAAITMVNEMLPALQK